VELVITVEGTDDELRSLYQWLADDDGFRGHVRLVDGPPQESTLGSAPELIAVALAQGGACAAVAGAVVAWLRHRTRDVMCKITRADGASVELSARRARTADLPALRELVTELATALNEQNSAPRNIE